MEPLTEGEAGATVQDVLALIDACDTTSEDCSSPSFWTQHRFGSEHARRDESHSYYRTRSEMQRLRLEAAQLEGRLVQLKSNRDPIYEQRLAELMKLNANALRSKQSIERVQSELKGRQESERTNRQLKALLVKYVQMIQVMESAFDMITDADISLVFNSHRAMTTQSNRRMQDEQTLDMLADRLSRLELDVDHVVDNVSADYSSTRCDSLRKFDADRAVVFESVTSRAMDCSLDYAHRAIVEKFTYHMAKRKVLLCGQQLSDTHRTEALQFQHEQQSFDLVDKARMRKLEQPGRVVYLRSAVIALESEELTFIEDGIFLIVQAPPHALQTNSNVMGSSGSILVGLHRIRADRQDTDPTVPERGNALNALKERVVHLSCERNRQFLYKMRKLLHKDQQEIDVCGVQV